MDSHELLEQLLKNIAALETDLQGDLQESLTAGQAEELLTDVRQVEIDGDPKEIFYDEEKGWVTYIAGFTSYREEK